MKSQVPEITTRLETCKKQHMEQLIFPASTGELDKKKSGITHDKLTTTAAADS